VRPGSDSVARYRAAFAQRNLVQEIEALAARAWPPLTILDLDGWQLRSSGGLTRRANSVWPRGAGTRLDLDARLAQAEAFYLQGGLDPTVLVSPSAQPRDLDAALRARGYRATPEVEVRTRRLAGLADAAPAGTAADLVSVGEWLPRWADAAGAASRAVTMAERMLARTLPDAAFAVVRTRREVAVARGVLDAGWLGVDLLAATPGLRDADTGRALLAALGRWAEEGGGERAWTEVDTGDAAAVALLARAGFRRGYAHRYRVRPRALVPRSPALSASASAAAARAS
jgi:N-acetylglutamate synthase